MAVRPEADNTDTHLDNSSVHQIDGGFEEVEQYQYLGSILRNDCSIDEEIDTRICKASIAFRSIGRLIWYQKKLKKKTKMRLFKSNIMPILLYGCETWAPLSNHVQRLQSFVNKCVQSICEISMRDMFRNTEIRRGNIERVDSILQLKRLKWLGHIERMADSRWPKKLLVSKICGGKRSQSGQKHRWHDVVNNDLKAIGLVSGWRSKAKNRIEWRKSINTLIIDLNQNKEQSEKDKKDRKKELNVQCNNTTDICSEVNINSGVLKGLACSFSGSTKLQLTKLALQTTSDRNTHNKQQ